MVREERRAWGPGPWGQGRAGEGNAIEMWSLPRGAAAVGQDCLQGSVGGERGLLRHAAVIRCVAAVVSIKP